MMRLIDADEFLKNLDHSPLIQDAMRKAFDHMPTIEERKKGKWLEREVSDSKCIEEWQSAKCSVCGRYHTTPYMYFFHEDNFCPNCGADMRQGGTQ